MSLLLKGCHLIDATSPDVRQDAYVRIEGETITDVGQGVAPAADRTLVSADFPSQGIFL